MFSAFQKISQSLQGASAAVSNFFNLVSLLLNTTATNGAQNNTFLDSSSNNFSITRNGNPTQGTFTPFSQAPGYWSNFFDGVGDGLSYSGTTFGSGAWTAELWFYFTGTSFTGPIQLFEGTTDSLVLAIMSSTTIRVDEVNVSNDLYTVPTMSANTWYHLAATKDASGNQTLFLNGVRSSTGVTTTSRNFSSATLRIAYSTIGGTDFTGYYSNLRFVTGTAVYNPLSSTITVPTAPLTAISGTQLLTCQSNQFVDNSTNAFTLTPSGTPSVQAFSPFLPTAAYSTSVVGGSYYGDGSGDSIYFQDTTQSGTSSSFNLGASNNASVDHWWYPTAAQSTAGFNKQVSAPTDWSGQIWYQVNLYDSGNISFFYRGGNNFQYIYGALPANFLNQWNHVAVASDTSNNLSIFFNGVRVATTNTTIGLATATNYITFGQQAAGQAVSNLKGYMSGLRFIQGSGAYNAAASTITVPTAPPTSTGTTQLLLSCTNAGIFDSAAKNDARTVGNAQVSTTQAKFGTTSMGFDGTGDNLEVKLTNAIGSGDYTIEGFFYIAGTGTQYLFDIRETSQAIGAYIVSSTTTLYVNFGTTFDISASSAFTLNSWNHLAFVRSGSGTNNTSVFLNGSRVYQRTDTTNYSIVPNLFVACENSGNYYLNGYVDEFRITKGYAVYSGATYTVPTAAFPLL